MRGPPPALPNSTSSPDQGTRPFIDRSSSVVLAIYNERKRTSTTALNEPPLRVGRLANNVEPHTQGVKRGRIQLQPKRQAKKSRVGHDSEAIAALERIKAARLHPVSGG